MTDERESGPPDETPESEGEPQPPDQRAYERRFKRAVARGEDPMPIFREHVVALLDWLKAKHVNVD